MECLSDSRAWLWCCICLWRESRNPDNLEISSDLEVCIWVCCSKYVKFMLLNVHKFGHWRNSFWALFMDQGLEAQKQKAPLPSGSIHLLTSCPHCPGSWGRCEQIQWGPLGSAFNGPSHPSVTTWHGSVKHNYFLPLPDCRGSIICHWDHHRTTLVGCRKFWASSEEVREPVRSGFLLGAKEKTIGNSQEQVKWTRTSGQGRGTEI